MLLGTFIDVIAAKSKTEPVIIHLKTLREDGDKVLTEMFGFSKVKWLAM